MLIGHHQRNHRCAVLSKALNLNDAHVVGFPAVYENGQMCLIMEPSLSEGHCGVPADDHGACTAHRRLCTLARVATGPCACNANFWGVLYASLVDHLHAQWQRGTSHFTLHCGYLMLQRKNIFHIGLLLAFQNHSSKRVWGNTGVLCSPTDSHGMHSIAPKYASAKREKSQRPKFVTAKL